MECTVQYPLREDRDIETPAEAWNHRAGASQRMAKRNQERPADRKTGSLATWCTSRIGLSGLICELWC